ncbi:MAG: ABC transporter permease subunit [Clostridiales bacterium]|jgi:arabinogalactan oligomer/maltooligosaccharide transport system permease protein|nr:ABC transporter permease subunit [Clostridiales bacterium]
MKKPGFGMRAKRIAADAVCEGILIALSVVWLIPVLWIALQGFRGEGGALVSYYFPKTFTFANYAALFTDALFPRWIMNTLTVAVVSCVMSVMLTLMVAYSLSRFKFKQKKFFMNVAMVLGMFPGFMSMIAVYYIFKAIGLDGTLIALVIVYSSGGALGFYVAKGYFDTLSLSLDEAAKIDGAKNWQVFFIIILPLARPIIVYTALMAFLAPWTDFIFARVILGTNRESYTVAIGLYDWVSTTRSNLMFTQFAAGSMVVAVPIVLLFIFLQKYYVEGITGGAVKG